MDITTIPLTTETRIDNSEKALRKMKTLYNECITMYRDEWMNRHFPEGPRRTLLNEALRNGRIGVYDANIAVERQYLTYDDTTDKVTMLIRYGGIQTAHNTFNTDSYNNYVILFMKATHNNDVDYEESRAAVEEAWLAQMNLIQETYRFVYVIDDDEETEGN